MSKSSWVFWMKLPLAMVIIIHQQVCFLPFFWLFCSIFLTPQASRLLSSFFAILFNLFYFIFLTLSYLLLGHFMIFHLLCCFFSGKKVKNTILILTFWGYSQFGSYILVVINLVSNIFN